MDRLWRLLRFIARSAKRLTVLVVGLGVVGVGIVMIPAPGPGWLVVFAGLALLATEFTWAEILLERAKRQATKAKDLAVRSVQSRRQSGLPTEAPADNGIAANASQTRPTHVVDAPSGGNGGDGDRPGGLGEMASEHPSP